MRLKSGPPLLDTPAEADNAAAKCGQKQPDNNDRNIKGIADAIPLSAINSEIIDFARKEERTLPAV